MKRGVKDRNRSKGTLCTQYSDEILSIFGINVVEDTDHKHSSFLCKKCQCRLVNFKNRNNSCEKAVETALDSFEKACGIWPHYDESVSTGQCQPVSVNRSVSTGQCQLVSVNRSVSTGQCQLVSVNWSVSTGQCQLVSVNRSVSTGQCQPVSVNWSTGQCQLVSVNWSVSVQLVPTLTRNAEQAGPKRRRKRHRRGNSQAMILFLT